MTHPTPGISPCLLIIYCLIYVKKIIFEIICFYQDGLRLVPHIIQPPHACCYGDSTMQHIQKAFLKISMLYCLHAEH